MFPLCLQESYYYIRSGYEYEIESEFEASCNSRLIRHFFHAVDQFSGALIGKTDIRLYQNKDVSLRPFESSAVLNLALANYND